VLREFPGFVEHHFHFFRYNAAFFLPFCAHFADFAAKQHNIKESGMTQVGNVAGDQLRSYIERIEKLEEEKSEIATDIREVFAEAKGNGFDVKTMRQIIKLRKMDHSDRDEAEYLLDVYKRALGMAPDDDEAEAA
jgi:uncharacterized protein (UPF0335 family)